MTTRSILAAGIAALASTAWAADVTQIRCSFRAEGFEGGKPNYVSCSLAPEKVFSTNSRRHPADQSCMQKSNGFQQNYENYVIDLIAKTVNYDETLIISDFAKPQFIEYQMKEGKSREEATQAADVKTKREKSYPVDSVDHTTREIFYSLTGKLYDPPKEMPTYIVRYGETTLHYTVGVPEASLIEATGDEEHSWVNIRFGLCESE